MTVVRGKIGYGFTISGQNPCMLSCIVPGSPAEAAGLKPGDLLYVVNGLNVSKACHDDVVRMVGLSTGALELQVGENLNTSDSSDDDYPPRCKSRYPNRVRPRQMYEKSSKPDKNPTVMQQEKKGSLRRNPNVDIDSDLSSSLTSQEDRAWPSSSGRGHDRESSFESRKESAGYDRLDKDSDRFSYASMPTQPVVPTAKKIMSSAAVVKKVPTMNPLSKHVCQLNGPKLNYASSDSSGSFRAGSVAASKHSHKDDEEELPKVAESVRAIVGYIGSIETPSSHTRPHQRLQALRNAVRRLRVEKRVHTLVLMEVNPAGVVLTNPLGKQLAFYPSERIAFSGICPDDERFFGLVTLGLMEDDASCVYNTGDGDEARVPHSSCHIFMIEPELSPHSAHSLQAEVFQINCTKNPQTRRCDEFPGSATSLILCIANLYRYAPQRKFDTVTEIVQSQALTDPSGGAGGERSVSSSNSNNSTSDSGLGFTKEEAPLEQNEQVCIVDLPTAAVQQCRHHNNSSDMSVAMDTSVLSQEIDVVSTPQSAQRRLSAFDLRRGMNTSTSSEECWQHGSRPLLNNRLTPQAMPDPSYPPQVLRMCKSSECLQRFPTSAKLPAGPANAESLRQSMQRLLQARHQKLQEQNMQLGSDGESHAGDPPPYQATPPVMSLSVADNGMAVLESAGGETTEHVVSSAGSRFSGPGAGGDIGNVGKKAEGLNLDTQQGVFAVPSKPPPNSIHNHVGSGSGDAIAVRSAFQVPRPVSAPISKQRSRIRVETVDMDTLGKLSPRAFPNSTPTSRSVFRSPSAPPAPFFPHRDSDDDDDDEEDEDDPYIRHILEQFSIDRRAALNDTSRRFSEGFALSQKRDKERQQELQSGYPASQKWSKAGSLRRGAGIPPATGPVSLKQSFSQSHESLAVGEDPNSNNAKLLGACSVNNIASQTNDRAGQAQDNKAGRVASWAVNFQNLLFDPVGVEIFTEFLQKEFSEENIIFWKACEQYRQLKDEQQRKLQAQDIYSRYLSNKASDPVNVDSAARSHTQQFLDSPTAVMFDVAQNQIFQLMRQDSYSRFLKSDLYKLRLMDEMAGKPLAPPASSVAKDTSEAAQGDNATQDKKKGKGKENEDKRRRSILPWRNGRKSLKNNADADSKKANKRTKEEKDKEQQKEQQQQQTSNMANNLNTSITSGGSTNSLHTNIGTGNSSNAGTMKKAPGPGIDLSTMRKEVFHPKDSQEVSESQFKFCRIVMPDGSTTVVCAKPGQSTRFVLGKLCEKRSISLASVDVFLLGSDRLLDLNEDISQLGSKEIIIEPRVMFRLDMPSGKSIGVKAKPNRSIRDVFRPIMHKYGYRMEGISVRLVTSQEFLDLDVAVSELDKQRAVIVCSNPDVADWVRRGGMPGPDLPSAAWAGTATERPPQSKGSWRGGSLEEITNKIFEDLMRGKSQLAHGFDELGVLELDKPKAHKNEEGRSSGLFGLLRKESMGARDTHKNKMKGKVTFALPLSESKKKSNAKEGERLFELLSGAQSLRIEEQRGVLVSPGELPSFLSEDKNKNSQPSRHGGFETLATQQQLFDDVTEISRAGILEKKAWRKTSTAFEESFPQTPRQTTSTPRGTKYGAKTMAVTPLLAHSDQSFSQDGVIPTPDEAEAFFRMSPMIVDSHVTAVGMSLNGALELRNGDKYPENELGRIGKSSFSRSSSRHAFQPLNSPTEQRAKAPVASPEKFSPQKKKQRSSPEHVLESNDGNLSIMTQRSNLSTFSPSSLISVPDNLSSTPRQNYSHINHSTTTSVYPNRSASASSFPSSHPPTRIQHNSPSPHTMATGLGQGNSTSPNPTYTKSVPQTHHRGVFTPNKNRMSDGMLIHKLTQAQSQKDSMNTKLNSVTPNTRNSFTRTINLHAETIINDRKSPEINANLAQRALLSPRFDNTPLDKTSSPSQPTTPSQRALLSPRFEQVRNSGRENREPFTSQSSLGGIPGLKKNHHINETTLSPRYSKGSVLQNGDISRIGAQNYQVSNTLPVSNLPQFNTFRPFMSKPFSSPVPHPTAYLQGEETVTFV